MTSPPASASVALLRGAGLRYKQARALDDVSVEIPAGCMVGLIGPDGVGKSSLLSLVAGARAVQDGQVQVLGGDMARAGHRRRVCPRIAYMPQGLGKNLYPTLSVEENLQFFARLFGHGAAERRRRIDHLTRATGLHPFLGRPAGKLSGGMKQKLGLCCALIHDPELLILDEPTTGVDPLARAQFWDLIAGIRQGRPAMSVLVATAYMDEAQRFDWLLAMDGGRVLAEGSPAELMARTGTDRLEAAFIALLPEDRRRDHRPVQITPLQPAQHEDVAIEAEGLTMRFGDFVAVDDVSFRSRRGEIFGFLGSNGCGKTTTMKMLTGLLSATEGRARLFGQVVGDAAAKPRQGAGLLGDPHADMALRRRVGYMSQSFSLYGELTVEQNLALHARLFHVPAPLVPERVSEMAERFGLQDVMTELPSRLPLGVRQRLSLAVAMVHKPDLLILDEPTSGVDPVARDAFWRLMIELSRRDGVTIFISTHFMNEAERCDRISLMHAGRVLVSDTPAAIVQAHGAANLEQAFINCLRQADHAAQAPAPVPVLAPVAASTRPARDSGWRRSLRRFYSYAWRESLELQRDPVRGALALFGSLILMFVMGYGISMDVDELRFAVLDHDQTALSRDYVQQLSGSRYFTEQPSLVDDTDMDQRLRSGDIALALEIPAGFARRVGRGDPAEIGAWIDGAMPQRAETVSGYVQGMHQHWLVQQITGRTGQAPASPLEVETRFRYNPDVKSMPAMVPAVIPLLLLMLPSMLTALAVVREKELGSIINLYVTPTTRTEFLLGKQAPYLVLAMFNFAAMTLLAVTAFDVPLTGSLPTLTLATLLFTVCATGLGLLVSTLVRSQLAAIFFTMIGTMLPAMQYGGLINPVSSLEGAGRWIGEIYPASHIFTVSRGVFNKALGFGDLASSLWPLAVAPLVIVALAVLLLRKQES